MKNQTKECLRRALRTFFQAALGALAANLSIYIGDLVSGDESLLRTAVFTLGGLALSAGVAALMNLPQDDSEEEIQY